MLQLPFTRHFHPSVSLQANQLLDLRLPLSGSADIEQNTLVAFLDRFAYRNPKKTIAARGASIMQPAAVARSGAVSVIKGKGSRVAQADGYVNDEKFWNKKVEDVPADQVSRLQWDLFKWIMLILISLQSSSSISSSQSSTTDSDRWRQLKPRGRRRESLNLTDQSKLTLLVTKAKSPMRKKLKCGR